MFGNTEQEFSPAQLRELVSQGKIEETKKYINLFFARLGNPPSTVLYYSPAMNEKVLMRIEDIKNTYLLSSLKHETIINKKVVEDFNVQKWFFKENDQIYNVDVNPKEGVIYNVKGRDIVNQFAGYKHTTIKKYSEFSNEVQEGVNFIWDHIKLVW